MKLKSQRYCIVQRTTLQLRLVPRSAATRQCEMWRCGARRGAQLLQMVFASPTTRASRTSLALALAGPIANSKPPQLTVFSSYLAHSRSLSPLLHPHSRGQRISNSEEPVAVVPFYRTKLWSGDGRDRKIYGLGLIGCQG